MYQTLATAHPRHQVADRRRWMALTVLASLQFMLILDATVVNVALPSIKNALGFTQANLAWVSDAYLLVAGGFLLLGSRVADLLGRRRIFLAGALAFALGSLASASAQNQGMLIASRALQGLGEALAGPAALSIITVLFADARERTRALSIWGGLAGMGGTIGVLLGGVIVDLADWRWIFWINLPIAAMVLTVAPRVIPADRRRGRGAFDAAGAITATGGITAFVYALLGANRDGWTSVRTVTFFAAGAALLAAFVVIEGRLRAPLVPLRIFRARRLVASSVLMALAASALYAMFFLLTLHMQQVLGWSPLRTGVSYVAFGLAMLIGVGMASQLLPRIGVRPVLLTGLTLAAIGLALMTQLSLEAEYWSRMVPAMVVEAVGAGLAFVSITVTAVSEASDSDAGLASGLLTTSQQVGGALGLAVLVSIATSRTSSLVTSGHSPLAAQLDGSHLAFGIGACLLLGAAALAAVLVGQFEPTSMPAPVAITSAESDIEPDTLVA